MRERPDPKVVAVSTQAGAADLKSARWAQNRKAGSDSARFGAGVGAPVAVDEELVALGVAATDGAPIPTDGIMTRLGSSEGGRWAAVTVDAGANGEAQLDSASAASAESVQMRNEGLVISVD